MLPLPPPPTTEPTVLTLPNGVRIVVIRQPWLETATVAVFVRSGSAHEPRPLNGVSHFVEHMAFKGTRERDCRRINLDAERLGGEVNAHTDKDHTAFYVRGLAVHAPRFVGMLADIVLNSTFPEDELAREREVILHELAEDEDDAMSAAFKLFDSACFGLHPVAQPVIGNRRNIERIGRDDLIGYVGRQYTGCNLVVAVAGAVDGDAMARAAEAAFGAMAAGTPNRVAPPAYVGGIKTRRLAGSSQTHVVMGFPAPTLSDDDPTATVAAALFGEGMSSPLMDQLRERRGLVYYAGCSADVLEMCGQFVIEASTGPQKADEYLREVMRLLAEQATRIDPVDLERARNQAVLRCLGTEERPLRRLEEAALDLFARGHVRSRAQVLERNASVTAGQLSAAFQRMLDAGVSVAMTGSLPRGASERVRAVVAAG